MADPIVVERGKAEAEEQKADRAEAEATAQELKGKTNEKEAKENFRKAVTASLAAAVHRDTECDLAKMAVDKAKDDLAAAEKALSEGAAADKVVLGKKVIEAAEALEAELRKAVAAHAAAAEDYERANRCQEKLRPKKGEDLAHDAREIDRHRAKAEAHLKIAKQWCEWIARVNRDHPDKLADFDEATKWLQMALLYQSKLDNTAGDIDQIQRITDAINDVAKEKADAKKKGLK